MKNVVLSIWYTQEGKARKYEQGKIYQEGKKWVYLADMDDAKLWRNYNGYSISKQITDVFSNLKLRVRICYRIKKQGLMYETNLSTFTGSKSILVNYGRHSQWVLPLKNWKVRKAISDEPKDLPVVDLAGWVKGDMVFYADGTFGYI